MQTMWRLLGAACFCAGAAGCATQPDMEEGRRSVGRDGNRCESVVDEQLAELQVDRSEISETIYSPKFQYDGDDNRRTTGIDAWVRFNSCQGALIVDMYPNCRLRQVYTRGECQVPGVTNW